MDARVTFITLAVADVAATRRFYVDGLGWQPELEVPGEVLFFRVAPSVTLSLWSREQFEAEVGPVQSGAGAPPITLAHNMPDPAGVDEVLEAARGAGATVSPATEREWGGYTGYFADPDGFRWEVAHNPGPIGVDLLRAAGVIPPDDTEDDENDDDIAAFDAAMAEEGPTIPWTQVQADLDRQ